MSIQQAIAYLEKIEQLTEHGPQQYARAALAALRSMPAEPVPDGYRLIAVTNLDPLVMALDRAFSKGYLPDALEKPWADFDWEEVATPPTAPVPLSDAEIREIADSTKTAEPGRDGYILPYSFARAIERAVLGRGEKL